MGEWDFEWDLNGILRDFDGILMAFWDCLWYFTGF